MKNKMLARRIAIAMLSAATVMTAAPVGAFAAETTSLEASDTAIKDSTQVVVVRAYENGKASVAETLKTKLGTSNLNMSADGNKIWDDKTKDYATGKTAADAKGLIDEKLTKTKTNLSVNYVVDESSIKFTDSDHYTFNVYNGGSDDIAADPTEVYSVTVSVEKAKLPDAIKNALDNYFNVHEFKIAKGQTITNGSVVAQLNKQQADTTNEDADKADEWTDSDENTRLSATDVIFAGNTTALTVTDGKASGSLTVSFPSGSSYISHDGDGITGTTTFTYNFTANVTESDKTASETNAAAIAAVNAKTYPTYGENGHSLENVKSLITKDLTDAGYVGNILFTSADNDSATKTADGFYTAIISGTTNSINVKLAYSSDQKSADTTASIAKVLKGQASDTIDTVTTHSTATAGKYNVTNDTNKTTFADSGNVKSKVTIPATSSLSLAAQAKDATKEATKDEVVKAVKDAIDAQLKADGVDQNGVKVTVEAVNKVENGAVVDGHTAATTKTVADNADAHGGKWTLLVKTSIANDFAALNGEQKTKDTKTLVVLETNELKDSKTTGVALADKTVNLSANYAASGSQTSGAYTYVELTPTFTPADANDTVSYTITDKNGDIVANNGAGKVTYVDDSTQSVNDKIYALKATDATKVGTRSIGLAFKNAGTYTVKVTSGDKEATATVNVVGNFEDVKSGAYYSSPITWGYANGIVAGYNDTTFGVNDNVTRGQFVTFLYRLAVKQDPKAEVKDADVKAIYSDVATTSPYAKAVQWAADNKVAFGTGDGKFDPNGTVTRAQAISFIYRMKGQPDTGATGSTTDSTAQFTDIGEKAYYRAAVTWGVNTPAYHTYDLAGKRTDSDSATYVVSGTSTTTFTPDAATTRAQAITFIYRAFGGNL